jgi:hypothetical protein
MEEQMKGRGTVTELWRSVFRRVKKPMWYLVRGLTGVRIAMPIRYLDFAMVGAEFYCSAARARERMPSPRLHPVEPVPGKALVSLMGLYYRHVDILVPYSEFAITIPVAYQSAETGESGPGLYYLHLPVTTEDARWGGVELYGFPKYLADIVFDATKTTCRCRLGVEGREILCLEVMRIATQSQSWYAVNYTVRGDQLVRSEFRAEGQLGEAEDPSAAWVALGDHPVAEELRGLEMELSCVRCQDAPQASAVLTKPLETLPL